MTQLDCQICKTAKKSKKPAERIGTLLSTFDTEVQIDGRHSSRDCLSVEMLSYLRSTYELLKPAAVPTTDAD